MKIINIIAWLDGGSFTIEVLTDKEESAYFFIDNSLQTIEKGKLYFKNFNKDNCEIAKNDPIRDELKVALADYKQEFYEHIIQHLIKTL